MKHDEYGRAITVLNDEAKAFREKDLSFHPSQKDGHQKYDRYKTLYTWDVSRKLYYLPPSQGLGNVSLYKVPDFYRDNQKEVMCQLSNKRRSTLVKAPTATGKTVMGIGWIAHYTAIIITPSIEICKGWLREWQEFGAHKDAVLMSADKIKKTEPNKLPHVIILTQASYLRVYEYLNDINRYTHLIRDEAHNLSKNAVAMINTFTGSAILGLTATPLRKDLTIDGFKLYRGDILETEAPNQLPVRVQTITFPYRYSQEEYEIATGDYSPESPHILRNLANNNQVRTQMIIHNILKYCKDHNLIIFFDRSDYLETMHGAVSRHLEGGNNNIKVYKLTGDSHPQIEPGHHKLVFAMVKCAGEGRNCPDIDAVMLTFNTSRSKTLIQMAGRGTRAYGDKKECLFIDIQDDSNWMPKGRKRNKIYKDLGFTIQ